MVCKADRGHVLPLLGQIPSALCAHPLVLLLLAGLREQRVGIVQADHVRSRYRQNQERGPRHRSRHRFVATDPAPEILAQ